MKVKIEGKEVELLKGETIHGFSFDVPGSWRIESLRPFEVMAIQGNKTWYIDVKASEFALRKLQETERK